LRGNMSDNEDKLIKALKDTFWKESAIDDFDSIHDCIIENFIKDFESGKKKITEDVIKSLFYMLPQDIFGDAVKWGIDDTEVRDNIYIFIQENKEEVEKFFKK